MFWFNKFGSFQYVGSLAFQCFKNISGTPESSKDIKDIRNLINVIALWIQIPVGFLIFKNNCVIQDLETFRNIRDPR